MIIREAVLLSLVVSKLSHSIYDDLLLLVLSQTLRAVHNLIKQTFPKPEAPGSPATTRLCFQVLSLCLSLRSPRWEALLCAFLACVCTFASESAGICTSAMVQGRTESNSRFC